MPIFEDEKSISDYRPTLFDFIRYSHNYGEPPANQPLVGEETAFLTTFLSFIIGKRAVLIKSYSGTGKTILMDVLLSLIPERKKYSIELGSEKSVWYQWKAIADAKYIEFPELQKTAKNLDVIEILKNWGEQKSAKRSRTDMIETVTSGEDSVIETVLDWKPFITSVAVENKDSDVQRTEEFLRRVVRIHTDPSKEMTQRVIDYKLMKRAVPEKMVSMSRAEFLQAKIYVDLVLKEKYGGFIDPTAPSINDAIPKEFAISRSLIDYLGDVINAVCLFNFKERIKIDDYYFIAPEDTWVAWEIYGKDFIESCLKIPSPLGREVHAIFPPVSEKLDGEFIPHESEVLTEAQVAQKLKAKGFMLEKFNVRPILSSLVQNSMLDIEGDSKPRKYYKSQFVSEISEIDWHGVLKETKRLMRDEYPDIADEYIKVFCKEKEIIHPITGETVTIFGKETEQKTVEAETKITEVVEKLDIDLEDFN